LITHVCTPSIESIVREAVAMNPHTLIGWALALAALVVGWLSYGWQGLVLAVTVIVFWLLLQFNRAVRVLRIASANAVGHVANAVMLHAQLKPGMRLPEVLVLTRALGRKVAEDTDAASESWAWTDAGGDSVQLVLRHGRLVSWELQRAAA
jgi:hypothetical protein